MLNSATVPVLERVWSVAVLGGILHCSSSAFQFSVPVQSGRPTARDIFVSTPSIAPFSHLMSSALLLHRPALLCSPTGCGKSAVARAVLYGAHASQTLRRSWEIRAAEVLLGSHSTAGEVRSCVDRWFGRRTAGARKAFHTEAQALRVR